MPENNTKKTIVSVNNIEVIYDHFHLVLKGVSFSVPEGAIVTLLGANGAGKSTTLKAISGLLHGERGEVTKGEIMFMGERIDHKDAADIVRLGIIQVMEGRRIFEHLTPDENIIVGAATRGNGHALKQDLERIYTYFPILAKRRESKGGYLSGGEQQMLAIGRALMARPKLMLLDEPSLGLGPLLVQEIYEILRRINKEEGVSMLIVEQNAAIALEFATYGYVMENGRVVMDGDAEKLKGNEDVREFYLGLSGVGKRKSYKDVKHYKRRKRWLA